MKAGSFIVLEGIDASGTTTQAEALGRALRARGYEICLTREPSTGHIGRQIRAWLSVEADAPGPEALALLFAADRLDHLRREVLPAVEAGQIVICDRYLWSSYAYQGLDCEPGWVRAINSRARVPDLALWLEVPVDVALARSAKRLAAGGAVEERFDDASLQQRLHEAYASYACDPDDPLQSVSAADSIETVTERLLALCVDAGL